ncbi:MAG TPA: hypothetical protein VM368_07735 [Flavisolibacter sp.]|nr:hypothetical protein [Flavisolibacter sp.]
MKRVRDVQLNVIPVQVIVLAVQIWLIVPNCALIVQTSVISVQLFVQEGLVLRASSPGCVLTFVKPVPKDAENMIMNNVNAVLKHVEDVPNYVETW